MIALSAPLGTQAELAVKITPDIESVQVKHGKQMVTVQRNQDTNAVVEPDFAKTSRACPPFCAQPMHLADGVLVVGEVEVIHFMTTQMKDGTGLLVDARTSDWHAKGTIPGSVNVPYTDVNPKLGADEVAVNDAMETFGVVKKGTGWDFGHAKTLMLWCNGPWCGQSPTAIHGLIDLGYPADKLLYYRGGMQMWKIFGLTVVPPADDE
jgi:rhodanese-related sulfurtransferase